MSKVLILDDRVRRQFEFLPGQQQGVDRLEQVNGLDNMVGLKFRPFIDGLSQGEWEDFLSYDLWIIHRSLLVEKKLLAEVQKLAKTYKKSLILFSGSITQHSYSESDFPFLIINSQVLYSERLFRFLDKYTKKSDTKLIELIYGDSWELTYLFKYRQVLEGVVFPGGTIKVTDELEQVLGELNLEQVNTKIDTLLMDI